MESAVSTELLTISVETIRDGRAEILSRLLSETDFYMTYTKLKVLSFKSCFPAVINFSPNSSVLFVNKLILIFFSTNKTVLCSIFPRCNKADRIILVQTVFVFDSLSRILLETIHILLFHFFLCLSLFIIHYFIQGNWHPNRDYPFSQYPIFFWILSLAFFDLLKFKSKTWNLTPLVISRNRQVEMSWASLRQDFAVWLRI